MEGGDSRRNREKRGPDRPGAGGVRARPKQDRAKFTVDAIVSAATELLVTHGVEALTTRGIAARAGVSVGTIYQYFADKEAILQHISNAIMNEASIDASPELFRLHRQSLDELLSALFARTVETERRLYGLGKDFYRKYARNMQFGRVQGAEAIARSSEQLVDNMRILLEQHASEAAEADRELAAFLIVRGLRMMLAVMVEERPELLESPSLVPLLARVARAITDHGGAAG